MLLNDNDDSKMIMLKNSEAGITILKSTVI